MASGEKRREERGKGGDGGRRQKDGKRGTGKAREVEKWRSMGGRRWGGLGYKNKGEGLSPSSPIGEEEG
nr:hypothetical protein [uncultured Porphyromonas sp.]